MGEGGKRAMGFGRVAGSAFEVPKGISRPSRGVVVVVVVVVVVEVLVEVVEHSAATAVVGVVG